MTTPQKPMSLEERAKEYCYDGWPYATYHPNDLIEIYLAGARGVIEEMRPNLEEIRKVLLQCQELVPNNLMCTESFGYKIVPKALAILQGLIGGSHDPR